jgi:hypothetical protein
MKTLLIAAILIVAAFVVSVTMAPAGDEAGSRSIAPAVADPAVPVGALLEEVAIGDRYLVPALPANVVDGLPYAEAAGDRYLAERIALAELVISGRIPAAERQAAANANDLPGFADVLVYDGFRRDLDGSWHYDRYASWMRFPLNR